LAIADLMLHAAHSGDKRNAVADHRTIELACERAAMTTVI
jgi:hypothetical protein